MFNAFLYALWQIYFWHVKYKCSLTAVKLHFQQWTGWWLKALLTSQKVFQIHLVFTLWLGPSSAQGASCRLWLCREGLFTATEVCLCCCERPFSSSTEPGFFWSLVLNEGLAVLPQSNQTLLPSCVPSLFLPLLGPPPTLREAAPWAWSRREPACPIILFHSFHLVLKLP